MSYASPHWAAPATNRRHPVVRRAPRGTPQEIQEISCPRLTRIITGVYGIPMTNRDRYLQEFAAEIAAEDEAMRAAYEAEVELEAQAEAAWRRGHGVTFQVIGDMG